MSVMPTRKTFLHIEASCNQFPFKCDWFWAWRQNNLGFVLLLQIWWSVLSICVRTYTSITCRTGAYVCVPRYGRHPRRFGNIYHHQGRNFLFQYFMVLFWNNEIIWHTKKLPLKVQNATCLCTLYIFVLVGICCLQNMLYSICFTWNTLIH